MPFKNTLKEKNIFKIKDKQYHSGFFVNTLTVIMGLLLSSALVGCTTTGNNMGEQDATLLGTQQRSVEKRSPDNKQTAALNGELEHYSEIGCASWYGAAFQGKRTANGEVFNMHELTAANKNMPLPSYARVTNLQNGSSLIVRVNDRGPYVSNRIIDLSERAAKLLGYNRSGLTNVKVDYISRAPVKGDDQAFLLASYRPPSVLNLQEAADEGKTNTPKFVPVPKAKEMETTTDLLASAEPIWTETNSTKTQSGLTVKGNSTGHKVQNQIKQAASENIPIQISFASDFGNFIPVRPKMTEIQPLGSSADEFQNFKND